MDLGLRNRVAVIAGSSQGIGRATAHCSAQEDTMAQVKQRAEAAIPRGRYGKPDEVTNLTIFLDSTAASSITGTTVLVEGGLFRRLM